MSLNCVGPGATATAQVSARTPNNAMLNDSRTGWLWLRLLRLFSALCASGFISLRGMGRCAGPGEQLTANLAPSAPSGCLSPLTSDRYYLAPRHSFSILASAQEGDPRFSTKCIIQLRPYTTSWYNPNYSTYGPYTLLQLVEGCYLQKERIASATNCLSILSKEYEGLNPHRSSCQVWMTQMRGKCDELQETTSSQNLHVRCCSARFLPRKGRGALQILPASTVERGALYGGPADPVPKGM